MTAGEQSHGPLQLTASHPVGFAPHLDVHGDDPAQHRCPCGARAWAEGAAPQPARRALPSPQGTGNSQARLKNISSEINVRGKLSEKSVLPLVPFYCHITGKKVSAVPPTCLPLPAINCCIIHSKILIGRTRIFYGNLLLHSPVPGASQERC